MKRPKSGESFVYLIAAGEGRIKVGRAKWPPHRLRALQIGCPDKLTIVRAFQTDQAQAMEQRLHQLLSTRRISGEWFEVTAETAVHLAREAYVITHGRRPAAWAD